MKKLLSLCLVLMMCISLAGCKNQEVKDTEELIAAIGEVSIDSESAILAAESAYAALTTEEKEKVETAEALTSARSSFDVIQTIALIDAIGAVNRNSEPSIIVAEEAYSKLPVASQALVTNYSVLTDARISYENIFVPVEITLENWQDYFEFVTEDVWKEDDFGDAIAITQYWVFRLKEEYADNVDMETMDIVLAYDCDFNEYTFEADFDNRTYSIGEDVATVYKRLTGEEYRQTSSTTADHDTWSYVESASTENIPEALLQFYTPPEARKLFSCRRFGIEHPEMGHNQAKSGNIGGRGNWEINYIFSLDNITISKIQGTITVIND